MGKKVGVANYICMKDDKTIVKINKKTCSPKLSKTNIAFINYISE